MVFFKTILVPVDFTINTEVAIFKALEIADAEDVVIHLLHICKPSLNDVNLGNAFKTGKEADAEIKLNEWKRMIEGHKPQSKVTCWIASCFSIERGIIDKSPELSPDLIVIGKRANHSLLPLLNTVVSSRIAKKTGVAVFTVKSGSLHKQIKHVIVPVNENVAESKINIVAALCKRKRIKISLVTFVNNKNVPEEFSASSLLQAYQRLKTISLCQVEYAVLHGQNKVKAMLQFAEANQADILLLKPYAETKIGWPDKHISDVIPAASKVQVLAV